MPSWIISTLTMANTLLLLLNLILLLLIWNDIDLNDIALRKREKKGGGRPKKDGSWYAHLEDKSNTKKGGEKINGR